MHSGIYRNSRSMVAHDQETQESSRTTADPCGNSTSTKQSRKLWTNHSSWKTINYSEASCFIGLRVSCRTFFLVKTGSTQSKRCDIHHIDIVLYFGGPLTWEFFFSIITINIDLFFFCCENSTLLRDQTEARRAKKSILRPPPYRRAWMTAPPPLSESLNPLLLYTFCCTCAPLVLDSDRHCPLDWAILLVHKEKELSPSIAINFFKK